MEQPILNYTAFAIPFFLACMLIEWRIGKAQHQELYHLGTAASDIGCGIVFQVSEFFFKTITFGLYAAIFQNFAVITYPENSWVPWVVAVLGIDFMFYWWHRTSHVVNVMWAVHGVHHQSEDYNLAVALRQPLFEPITWFFFYAPLALLGVNPMHYLVGYGINRLYQFFIHTELVGKLGPLEWIFNTPSHHRVHHGVQHKYLDRNYGAIFIVWDRLFGTFQAEEEAPVYGITTPIETYNPLWANFLILAHVKNLASQATSWRQKLYAWVAHPAWLPSNLPPHQAKPDPTRTTFKKYVPVMHHISSWYIVINFILIAGLTFVHVLFETRLPHGLLALSAATAIASQVTISGWTENKDWAKIAEPIRLMLLGAVAAGLALS